MATYTPDQYAAHLNKSMDAFLKQKKEIIEAIYYAVTLADERIFDRGENAKGGKIGEYSVKPLYINPTLATNRRKFQVKGKSAKSGTTFLNGKPRKTRYFQTYQVYKQSQGMAQLGNNVNLQITKHFRRAFLTKSFAMTLQNGKLIVKFGVKPSAANPIGKLQGIMIDKYPLAFKFSKAEHDAIIDAVTAL